MIRFAKFITESAAAAAASSANTALGAAYETAASLHLHNLTGSQYNQDKDHQKRIQQMSDLHQQALANLPPEKQKTAVEYGKKSAEAYLKSLEDNHGIKGHDVMEVHHTYAGIDKLVGKKVSQAQNPHDIAIKTRDGTHHGASLKYKSGTLSNSPVRSFDNISKEHGIETNHASIWNDHKSKAGLSGMTGKQIKAVRDKPEIKKANSEAQKASSMHHHEALSKASTKNVRSLLQTITKSNPDVPYDYVVGNKGTAEPIHDKHHHTLIKNAKSFDIKHNGTNLVKIHDHEGKHLMTFEHRPTHGAFRSVQINAKYGTGK